jgi:hypothetical protein
MLISHSGYMSRCIRRGHIPDCRSNACLRVSRQTNIHMFMFRFWQSWYEVNGAQNVCFSYEKPVSAVPERDCGHMLAAVQRSFCFCTFGTDKSGNREILAGQKIPAQLMTWTFEMRASRDSMLIHDTRDTAGTGQ